MFLTFLFYSKKENRSCLQNAKNVYLLQRQSRPRGQGDTDTGQRGIIKEREGPRGQWSGTVRQKLLRKYLLPFFKHRF